MALLTNSYLRGKTLTKFGQVYESTTRSLASQVLAAEKKKEEASPQQFDIFLSHSMEDAILIKALKDILTEGGYSVYVDWIDDPQLSRDNVSRETANVLRGRMLQCRSLLFATSTASKRSVWMPWELGYMDAKTKERIAIIPIVADSEKDGEFRGQEYLGLYPYFDKTGDDLYIHRSRNSYVSFRRWLEGAVI